MLPPGWAEKSFVLFCPIGEQQLLRYCGVFLRDDFRIAILAWFVHQCSACEGNFHFNFPRERRNIEMMTWDTISAVSTKAILRWTRNSFFGPITRYRYRNRLFYRSFIMNSVVSIDSSGYQNDNFPSCMRYVGARFIQVTDASCQCFHTVLAYRWAFPRFHEECAWEVRLLDNNEHLWTFLSYVGASDYVKSIMKNFDQENHVRRESSKHKRGEWHFHCRGQNF